MNALSGFERRSLQQFGHPLIAINERFHVLRPSGKGVRTVRIGAVRHSSMVEGDGIAGRWCGRRTPAPGQQCGSPEQVIDGWRTSIRSPDADMARQHMQVLRHVLRGEGFARPNPMAASPASP
jgi:hypothetical protein